MPGKTRKELKSEKSKLLTSVGLSSKELEDRAQDGTLSAHETDVLSTVRGIDYLLG